MIKSNRQFNCIYHLFFLKKLSVDDYILTKAANLKYVILKNIFTPIYQTTQRTTIIKKDIKNVFWNNFIAFY